MIIKSLVALCWSPNELLCSDHLLLGRSLDLESDAWKDQETPLETHQDELIGREFYLGLSAATCVMSSERRRSQRKTSWNKKANEPKCLVLTSEEESQSSCSLQDEPGYI